MKRTDEDTKTHHPTHPPPHTLWVLSLGVSSPEGEIAIRGDERKVFEILKW